ncbi:MAG: polymer-forming cytoskeletal protein [Pyrinomonadaceae bacterium]
MHNGLPFTSKRYFPGPTPRALGVAFLTFWVGLVSVFAQHSPRPSDVETMTIEAAPDQEVIAFSKNLEIKGDVKGVLVFGGDAIIHGNVTGDVGVIGGSLHQKKTSRISGDIFIVGGKYNVETHHPLRGKDRETLVYAGYEQELRTYARNPSLLFAPNFSINFLVQRLFSLLFWFTVGILMTLLSPGAISRSAARIGLSPLRITLLGAAGFFAVTLIVLLGVALFPGAISGMLGLMSFILIVLAYIFGRIVLQLSVGKYLLRILTSKRNPSDTFAIFAGTLFWTLALSIPYIWAIFLAFLFFVSIGIIVTMRNQSILGFARTTGAQTEPGL